MEHQPQVAQLLAGAGEGQVEDRRIEPVAGRVADALRPRIRCFRQDRRQPAQTGRQGGRSPDIETFILARPNRDHAGQRAGLFHQPIERLLQELRDGQVATDRGAHRVGDGEVLVLRDQLLLGPVQVQRHDHGEHHDRGAHDHRRGHVTLVAGQARVEDEEPDELEPPHEGDGQDHRRPPEAVQIADAR